MRDRSLDQTTTLRIADSKEVDGLDYEQKLQMIRTRLRAALLKRVSKCREEADGLQHDMSVAAERLDGGGFMADISSVRVAGYHINQTELLVLRKVWLMINSIIGGQDCNVDPEGEEDD